jgi:hypothetical protein
MWMRACWREARSVGSATSFSLRRPIDSPFGPIGERCPP